MLVLVLLGVIVVGMVTEALPRQQRRLSVQKTVNGVVQDRFNTGTHRLRRAAEKKKVREGLHAQ